MDGDTVDDEALKQFLGTTSFGKQQSRGNVERQISQSRRAQTEVSTISKPDTVRAGSDTADSGSPRAHDHTRNGSKHDSDDSDDDDEDDDDDDDDEFPTSHEMIIKTHDRAVTAASLDPAGNRLVTGSIDCSLKFHDFSSMTPTTIRAFKSVDPTMTNSSANTETHPVHHVEFNRLAPSLMLVVVAQPQARILNRDGETVATFVKGDMYLQDMHRTKGHVSEVTCGAWHPGDADVCATGGTDGTVRVWDINKPRTQRDIIVHRSKVAGSAGRTRITSIAWGTSGGQHGNNALVAAGLDGTLAVWNGDGPLNRPVAEVQDAHGRNTWTGGIATSPDGRMIVTRGGDDTIKLWDMRKFKVAVNSVAHVSTSALYPTSNISYSPNGTHILTGSQTGHVHILNPGSLRAELVTPVTPGSPLITVSWHQKLNQLITTSANAETHVLYDPDRSTGGAKAVMSRAPKRRHIDDDPNLTMDMTQDLSSIILPSESGKISTARGGSRNPVTGLTQSGRSRDPRRPNVPVTTPFAKSTPDAGYVAKHVPFSSMRDEDPREALLKYAGKGDKMFTAAWADTQPVTQYADLSDEEDGEPDKKRTKTNV